MATPRLEDTPGIELGPDVTRVIVQFAIREDKYVPNGIQRWSDETDFRAEERVAGRDRKAKGGGERLDHDVINVDSRTLLTILDRQGFVLVDAWKQRRHHTEWHSGMPEAAKHFTAVKFIFYRKGSPEAEEGEYGLMKDLLKRELLGKFWCRLKGLYRNPLHKGGTTVEDEREALIYLNYLVPNTSAAPQAIFTYRGGALRAGRIPKRTRRPRRA